MTNIDEACCILTCFYTFHTRKPIVTIQKKKLLQKGSHPIALWYVMRFRKGFHPMRAIITRGLYTYVLPHFSVLFIIKSG